MVVIMHQKLSLYSMFFYFSSCAAALYISFFEFPGHNVRLKIPTDVYMLENEVGIQSLCL
jgi:hypothetical protein